MTTTTREHFTTFTPDMAVAVREGRKTQTRRVIAHDARGADRVLWIDNGRLYPGRGDEPYVGWVAQVDKLNGLHLPLSCPYGHSGDHLRLGTTWGTERAFDGYRPRQLSYTCGVWSYFAGPKPAWVGKLRPARFMPLFLRDRMPLAVIESVRVERLYNISAENAYAEGMRLNPSDCFQDVNTGSKLRTKFQLLWDSINGARPGNSWADNPWVWALTFRRATP